MPPHDLLDLPGVLENELQPSDTSSVTEVAPTQLPDLQVLHYQDEDKVPWRYVKLIGRGSYGDVDEVVDAQNPNAVYARKKMRRESDHVAKRNFQNEYRNLRKLTALPRQQHLVHLVEAYTFWDDYFLVISPRADGTLRDLFDRVHGVYNRGDYAADLRILSQAFGCLARGLAFLHSSGIRHKDIKPTNILIRDTTVIYTDFGQSHEFDPGDSTTTGDATGYKRYRAPEMTDETKHNRKTDVFSLGCVYLEIIAAFREVDPRTSEWPLWRSPNRADRGLYAKNIQAFQTWLQECIESEHVNVAADAQLPKEILELCSSTIYNNDLRRIDATHLSSEIKIIDRAHHQPKVPSLQCGDCKEASKSDIELRKRWYCTNGTCSGGPFFDMKVLRCPVCRSRGKRREYDSSQPIANDHQHLITAKKTKTHASLPKLKNVVSTQAQGSNYAINGEASSSLPPEIAVESSETVINTPPTLAESSRAEIEAQTQPERKEDGDCLGLFLGFTFCLPCSIVYAVWTCCKTMY